MIRLLLLFVPILFLTSLAAAESVDTRQFGFIRPGMPEAAVISRLGAPDERRVLQRYTISNKTGPRSAISEDREKVLLIYYGDTTTMTAYITLDNGYVVSTDKRR